MIKPNITVTMQEITLFLSVKSMSGGQSGHAAALINTSGVIIKIIAKKANFMVFDLN